MSNDKQLRSGELESRRKALGLTQQHLALAIGVTQQAVAKWERSGRIPEHRLKKVAQHLRVSTETLLAPDEGTSEERNARVRAWADDAFGDDVVVCFPSAAFHYMPTQPEIQTFWRDLQRNGFAHLSAGPVQVLINVSAARRIDICYGPDMGNYRPKPVSPTGTHHREPRTHEVKNVADVMTASTKNPWFKRGIARVYIRGKRKPLWAHQTFFDQYVEKKDLSRNDVLDLRDAFDCERSDSTSIFDLFERIYLRADFDSTAYDRGEELHPDALHLFQNDDDGNGLQQTWVHTRDVQVIEVPTNLWEIYLLSVGVQTDEREANPREKRRSNRDLRRG